MGIELVKRLWQVIFNVESPITNSSQLEIMLICLLVVLIE